MHLRIRDAPAAIPLKIGGPRQSGLPISASAVSLLEIISSRL
jgi:hypothetical protein